MPPTAKAQKTAVTRRVSPSLDDFCAAIRDTNPFTANRITEPSSYDIDVPAIHAASFDRLVDLAARAMKSPTGIGVALLGGAGVGKSHLLSRLYRWANGLTSDGGQRACYVYLHNVLADPDRLPRYLLKYVVSRLSEGNRGPLHQTPLFGFVDRGIRHALAEEGIKTDTIEDKLKQAVDAFRSYFGKFEEARAAFEVLFQFWRHARPEKADDPRRRLFAASAIAWLSGDEVDPNLAAHLGFQVDPREPVMLRDDHEVEQVLRALRQLTLVSRQPFVLCIDQFENLDPEKIKPLSRFLHALLDRTSNLLVIASGVKQTLLEYKDQQIIPEAAWDRIAQYAVDLRRIKRDEARKILEARLERFQEQFQKLDAVRHHLAEDTLFPLGRAWLEKRLEDGLDFRPRDILTWARDAWDEEQTRLVQLGVERWVKQWPHNGSPGGNGGKPPVVSPVEIESAIDTVVDRKIEEQISQHRLLEGSLPPDAGNLAGLVGLLLGHCSGEGLPYTYRSVERLQKKAGRLPPYDLRVRERRERDGREVSTGVLFVTNVGLSATTALKRLLEDEKPPDHRILVTDHERRPLKVGAQGVEYYRNLEKLGPGKFEHLRLDFEQYARLDALQGVIGMAKSGDLEIEAPRGTPRPVQEAEVVASHHRRDRFRQHPLLRPLLTEEPPIEPPKPDPPLLDEPRVRQFIMAQLALRMGLMAQTIARGFVEEMTPPRPAHDRAWQQLKEIAGRMHAEGLVHATPQDDDLFLLMRK
jgi:hypothetical protein